MFLKSAENRTTTVVEIGNIENTLNASGQILPEFEQVITSPINASNAWSTILAPAPGTMRQDVYELHQLLKEAKLNPPFN